MARTDPPARPTCLTCVHVRLAAGKAHCEHPLRAHLNARADITEVSGWGIKCPLHEPTKAAA